MLTAMQRRLQGQQREAGFTLIELMVVVLIIAILIAVMGGAVGSMVIALYMPMFNIINLIK